MTSRQQVIVDSDTLERIAAGTGIDIELGTDRAYLTVGPTTFVAEIKAVA